MDDFYRSLLCRILILIVLFPSYVTNTWWYLSQLPVHSLSLVGSGLICSNIPGLIGRQKKLCRTHTDVMLSVVRGAKLGVRECQHQFSDNRWNCSTSKDDSSVFGKVMLKVGSREAAFVYAVSAAGVVHAITRSCSKGDLLNCACDPTKHGNKSWDRYGEFEWGGCSDNVRYGSKFSRLFIDAREKRVRDARAHMNLHNNRAGRRAVRKLMKAECKCHGVSGSCAIRTCWLAMKDFRKAGDFLRTRFNAATKVTMDQRKTGLVVADKNHKRPTRSDLVYFEASPDYCVNNAYTGSLGTAGRRCNRTSLGTDGCDIMCCGRGYHTETKLQTVKCECKFVWCCYVKCKECSAMVDVHTCKGPNPTAPPITPPRTNTLPQK